MGPGGLVTVSPEQLLAWNPEIVITIESELFDNARFDDVWKSIRAVREGRLHVAPAEPFPWIDFPPSVNRLIGLKWLARVLYPRAFSADLREETRRFYALFYHQPVDDRQLDALLKRSRASR
jgi:iron complex transport system substrate-binding protein